MALLLMSEGLGVGEWMILEAACLFLLKMVEVVFFCEKCHNSLC